MRRRPGVPPAAPVPVQGILAVLSLGFLALVSLAFVGIGLAPLAVEAQTPPAAADTAREGTGPVLAGTVRASGFRDGEGLPGAIIEFRQEGKVLRVSSGPDGDYRLVGVAPGRGRLHVFHIAATSVDLDVTLPRQGVLTVDLALERRVLALPPVLVHPVVPPPETVRPTAPFQNGSTRASRLLMPALASTSGMVESGLLGAGSAVSTPPGEEPGGADRVLFMRGSTVDSRQILLDGAPILTPFHLAGLVPSFDHRVLGDAQLHLGGASARYDGGLAYVLEVETREPRRDRVRVDMALDPVAGRVSAEVPLSSRAGFLGSIRGIHGAAGGGDFPYLYRDALARISATPGVGQQVHLMGFRNREGVNLDLLGPAGAATWGNEALSARWTRVQGTDRIEAGVSRSAYEASLPVTWFDPLTARTRSGQLRAEVAVAHGEARRYRWGGSVERQDLRWSLVALTPHPQTALDTETVERTSSRGSLFAEVEVPLGGDLHLRTGMRADAFGVDGSVRFAPRASLRYLISDDAMLTLSAGRYHEVLPVSTLGSTHAPLPGLDSPESWDSTPPAGAGIFWSPVLSVASATHAVLALDQALSDDVRLELSGFVKEFAGTDPAGPAAGPNPARRQVHASGTELRTTRTGDRVDAWAGYALSWVWTSGSALGATGAGEGERRAFAGRHLLTAGARVVTDRGPELGLTVGYGAGLPLTGVAVGFTPDAPRAIASPEQGQVQRLAATTHANPLEVGAEDAFLRLDLEASWSLAPQVAGRTTEFRPYLRVLNALDRRDALFHYFDRWRDEGLRPVATRPFLPLVGVEWRF
ncbi:MAG: TonB-dependent receptor [Gemmatimonadales bacterium]|nr:MAG: TonB-dependent receptor [Gemmatimonadales bacterium]